MGAQDLVPHITAARLSALRAFLLLATYVTWLLTTWLGPSFMPEGGFDIGQSLAALGAYSALTVGTFVALLRSAMSVVRSGGLRRTISRHVAPFWMVVTAALILGVFVRRYASTDDAIVSSWFALGVSFAVVLGALAVARLAQASRLESDRRQLAAAGVRASVSLF
jgi:hypothetical protein